MTNFIKEWWRSDDNVQRKKVKESQKEEKNVRKRDHSPYLRNKDTSGKLVAEWIAFGVYQLDCMCVDPSLRSLNLFESMTFSGFIRPCTDISRNIVELRVPSSLTSCQFLCNALFSTLFVHYSQMLLYNQISKEFIQQEKLRRL